MLNDKMLNIVIVSGPGDEEYIKVNIKLIKLLNEEGTYKISVIDNGAMVTGKPIEISQGHVSIIEGVMQNQTYPPSCRGSYHHAAALNKFLRENKLEGRYVLILDPDFYIIKKDWIKDILSYVHDKELTFFGVPWHPRWYTKYRYFPSVHCMFIDSLKIDLKKLDFTPNLVARSLKKEKQKVRLNINQIKPSNEHSDTNRKIKINSATFKIGTHWLKILFKIMDNSLDLLENSYHINGSKIPKGLKATIRTKKGLKMINHFFARTEEKQKIFEYKLRNKIKHYFKFAVSSTINRKIINSSQDTAYRLYQQFAMSRKCKYETMSPVMKMDNINSAYHLRFKLGRRLDLVFPDSLSFLPKRKNFISQIGFKEVKYPDVSLFGWEEFFWHNEPFGFHLRRFNKSSDRDKEKELNDLRSTIMKILKNNISKCSHS